MILGSVDVIPHQDLVNPAYDPSPDGDPDRLAPGDLPYACDAPYSTAISDFTGPTRVVGRLPDLTNGKTPIILSACSIRRPITRADRPRILQLSWGSAPTSGGSRLR